MDNTSQAIFSLGINCSELHKHTANHDIHHSIITLLFWGIVAISIIAALWLRKMYLTKENVNFSMSKMGKTVALYDIHNGVLYIPEAYAKEHKIPVKIKNMPEGFLEIMRDRTDSGSFKRLERFVNNIVCGSQDDNSTKIRILGRIDAKGRWLYLESCTFFKKGKPWQAYIGFEDLSIEYAHMLAFERFRMLDNSALPIGSDYSLLDATDDCIDITCGPMRIAEKPYVGMSIQEYHEANRGMRFYNSKGVSVMEFFSKENIIKYYEEGRHVIEDIWNGSEISGRELWLIFNARIIKDPHDEHIRCYLEYRDVTKIKLNELRHKEMSIRDGMTGLYNSKATREIVEQNLGKKTEAFNVMAIFDLDGFKKVNDTFGHYEGDKIIKLFSKKLSAAFDQEIVVGRIGGDEFLMYVAVSENIEDLKSRIEDFIRTVSFNVGIENQQSISIACSAGVVIDSGEIYDYDYLYKRADAALYKAKQEGYGTVAYYDKTNAVNENVHLVVNENDIEESTKIFKYLFENYGFSTIEDIFIVNDDDALILVNPNNYRVDYINMKDSEKIERMFPEWKKKYCYEVICGKKEPCENCRKNNIDSNMLMPREFECEKFKDDNYILLDRRIVKTNKDTHLHFLKKTTDPEYLDKMSVKSKAALSLLRYCVAVDMRHKAAESALKDIINILCEHFGNDYGYIGSFHRSVEAVFADNNAKRDKPVSDSVIESLCEYKPMNSLIFVRDVEAIKDENREAYDFFTKRGVTSFAIYPISKENLTYGYIYLENFLKNLESMTTVNEISSVLSGCFIRQLVKFHTFDYRYNDSLTGMLNYEGFVKKAVETFEVPDGKKYVIWCLSIKNYREILKAYDETIANKLVKYCAEYIAKDCPANEFFCRDYEGRFIGMSQNAERQDVKGLNAQLNSMLEGFLEEACDAHIQVKTSCGICTVVNNGMCNIEGAIAEAIAIKKSAKSAEGSNIAFSKYVLQNVDAADSVAENATYEALLNGEFEIYYQPKLNIKKKERKIYAEALARWIKDGKIFAMPGEFLPIIRNIKKMVEFDLYIFEKACESISEFNRQAITDLIIAVNLTEETILTENIVERFEIIRKEYGVPPQAIELEITEDVLFSNVDEVGNVVEKFRNIGYLCTLDDFGVERSTLYLLPQVAFDALKLDKKFFKANVNMSRQKLVVAHIIALATDLDMAIISEGVEKQEEIDFLVNSGCEYIQGYVHEKPMDKDAFSEYIRKYRGGGIEADENYLNLDIMRCERIPITAPLTTPEIMRTGK